MVGFLGNNVSYQEYTLAILNLHDLMKKDTQPSLTTTANTITVSLREVIYQQNNISCPAACRLLVRYQRQAD